MMIIKKDTEMRIPEGFQYDKIPIKFYHML
jgi:hypothetical protein